MKRFTNILRLVLMLGLTTVLFSSCVKKEYDEPTTANIDPNLTVTHTLSQFQALATTGVIPKEITTDVIISGIVVADDESGNFYKEVIIQDATAGLSIQLDVSNFYTEYPIGRRLFIKAKGLYIADDGEGNYQLGIKDLNTIGRIPSGLAGQYIVKGKWGLSVAPIPVNLVNISAAPTNCLIEITDSVEFASADAGVTYADGINLTSKNRLVEDCYGNSVKMYNSGYSKFANQLTPMGRGFILAINKLYNGASELIIRDTTDVRLYGNRCDGSSGQLTQISIDSLRILQAGGAVTCPLGSKIKGIVISDYANANTDPKNLVVQQGNAGIVVRFSSAHNFSLGAEVEVNVSGLPFSVYAGVIEITPTPNANAVQTGTGTVTPRIATVTEVNNNILAWQSTLVTVLNPSISGGTYGTSNILSDASGGSLTLYTRSAATFSGTTCPATATSLTGIVSQFNSTNQMSIRNTSDVVQ